MMRLALTVSIALTILTSCTHRYYIVRHAEKESAGGATNTDPGLSEAGKVRAIVLRDQLKAKHIRFIYVTNTMRARATADPISQSTGLPVRIYSTRDSLPQFIDMLKHLRKGNVLIIGHSNTVDDIVNGLCNDSKIAADLPESQYDNIFIVTYKGKRIRFEKGKYGYASNPE